VVVFLPAVTSTIFELQLGVEVFGEGLLVVAMFHEGLLPR